MTTSSFFCAFAAVLWLLDSARLRGRVSSFKVLSTSEVPVSDDHAFVVRPGVAIDDATRRSASAFARDHHLDVVDLVPSDLPAWRAMLLLGSVDPKTFRKDRLAKGRSAGEGLLVRASVLERMQLASDVNGDVIAPSDPVAFAALAVRLKLHACTSTDFGIAPGFRATLVPFSARGRLIHALFGEFAVPVVILQILFALAAPALALAFGAAALVVFHAQCLVATMGTALAPRDRALYCLFRSLIDLASALTGLLPRGADADTDRIASRRPIYAGLLAEGMPRFFEERRLDCPLCAGRDLSRAISTRDHYQFKPGHFTLERCRECAHVFQNPRLSLDGLGFYYRDFYDGLGEERLEGIFASATEPYLARARMLEGEASPSRWLDVGAGHGHFCCVAREVFPNAKFDGLDFSESIDDAVRRNWVDKGYRGLFPELAPELGTSARYDVVSMSHYLEHTRDPAAEIEAAAKVLPGGGMLMIELPDPDSHIGRLLGRLWLPWFQPQHQHLLSTKNLERILRANAFEPVIWHRGEAHQSIDFTALAVTLITHLARPIDLPWRAPTGLLTRIWNRLVWFASIPLLLASWILDRVLAPLFRRVGWSNTYRVLARRTA
jgi:SAM-dependent methyltransferase